MNQIVVIFCPNLVGDTVMATPTIRAIRAANPGGRLIGVIKPHVAPTLDGTPWLDEVIGFDARSRDPAVKTPAVFKRLRERRADLAVLLPNSFRSAALAYASGIPRRVGYSRGGRGFLLTDRLDVPRDPRGRRLPVPVVEYYLAIARRLGYPVDSVRVSLGTTADDEAAAALAWESLGLSTDRPTVSLNTGGAFGPAKSWPNESFGTLARRLATEAGVQVLVVCGPGERRSATEIVRTAAHRDVVSLAGLPLGIGLTKACVRRSSLMITTDSGPRHFAAAFGTPVITLFGPTHIAWTRTYHPHAVHMLHPVPCGPCQKPVCPLGHHRCMTDLTPESVFRAALRMLPDTRALTPRC